MKVLTIANGNHGGRRILYVAYPLLPVDEESAGGAEQVLSTLEWAAASDGWQTTVASCSGSTVAGGLYVTGPPSRGRLDSARDVERHHCRAVAELISVRTAIGRPFDLIHDHSGSFFTLANRVEAPVLATLHLPRSFYPPNYFAHVPANLFFNCVSKAQLKTFRDVPNILGYVPNGIPLERFPLQTRKQDCLLWLGRICEEKAPHVAVDAAMEAGMRLVLAGKLYPFGYHHAYFEREVRPRLERYGTRIEFIESPAFERKVELLRNARAVLITSQCEETSSLVAMEGAACGTPVIAFRRGALPEVVAQGKTGLLVRTFEQMVAATGKVGAIRARECRAHAERHFDARRMYRDYSELYGVVTVRTRRVAAAIAA